MATEILMPSLSPTMEEGILAKWLVKEGDAVKAGDAIAEVETDKATMEIEAPADGVILRLVVAASSSAIKVQTLLGHIGATGEAVPEGKPVVATVASAATAAPVVSNAAFALQGGERIKASPLARRVAEAAGVELSGIEGSGPRGRIVRKDVEAAASHKVPVEVRAPNASVAPAAAPVAASDRYEVVELDSMRRTIAKRLTESKQTVPHFYLRTDITLDDLLDLRQQLNASAPKAGDGPAWKISVNDMVVRALAMSLRDVPEANVSWADGKMLQHKHVDVSVAVAIDGGLITPVVADADRKSLSTLSLEIRDLAERARSRKLKPEEYQGGTTSISNLGMYGVTSFDAVINSPQATILAVGAGERRGIVRGDALVPATVMSVTLSVDHRVVDGAVGARVLAALKAYIETPLRLLV